MIIKIRTLVTALCISLCGISFGQVTITEPEKGQNTELEEQQDTKVHIPREINANSTNEDIGLDDESTETRNLHDNVAQESEPTGELNRSLPDDFPIYIDTGNPEADQETYKLAKEAWIVENPELYQELMKGGEQQDPDIIRTPNYISNESK